MNDDVPHVGEYVKLIKSGKIVRCKSYNSVKQTIEIIFPNGDVSNVLRQQVQKANPNEELAYLINQNSINSHRQL